MKKFTKNDESFTCEHCRRHVDKLYYTSRNHCPYCLYSIHVDNNPGDRENNCKGIMKPIGIEIDSKKGIVIVFKCSKCGIIKKNVSAKDDNYEKILKLSSHEKVDW